MRIYLSGPMTGIPGHNYDAFAEAAHRLRQAAYENVVSPHEVDAGACEGCMDAARYRTISPMCCGSDGATFPSFQPIRAHSWREHMKADICAMLECDTIVLLPGWHASKGARLELTIAMELGFTVYFYNGGAHGLLLIPMGRM